MIKYTIKYYNFINHKYFKIDMKEIYLEKYIIYSKIRKDMIEQIYII